VISPVCNSYVGTLPRYDVECCRGVNHTKKDTIPAMKLPGLLLLPVIISIQLLAQSSSPPSTKPCRILDVVQTVSGHDYYVDGRRAGSDSEVNLLELLRRSEASSPSSCLRLFVPTSVKVKEIENGRVVAGKMQYEEFHVYVYDEHRDWVNEILLETRPSANVRLGMKGTVEWPGPDSSGK
jgi:hypothetical protein